MASSPLARGAAHASTIPRVPAAPWRACCRPMLPLLGCRTRAFSVATPRIGRAVVSAAVWRHGPALREIDCRVSLGVGARWLSSGSRRAYAERPEATETGKAAADGQTPPLKPLRAVLKDRIKTLTPHENIYTVPNILTFSRLLATPVIGYLFISEYYVAAAGLFAYAGATDLIDGWIARRWKLQTVVGSVIDPMADKTLMTVLTVCLAVKGFFPLYLTTLILGRDISLAIAAIYYRFISLPPPRTFTRYWDFSLPSAEVHPTTISKANTALQLMLIGATVALPVAGPAIAPMLADSGYGVTVDSAMTAFQCLVAGTTIWSGASYLYTRNAVKILTGTEEQKRRGLAKGRLVIATTFTACLVGAGVLALDDS